MHFIFDFLRFSGGFGHNNYKIIKGGWSVFKQFADLAEATNYAASLGVEYTVEDLGVAISLPKDENTVVDKDFGQYLIDEFITDNRKHNGGTGTTPAEEDALMFKFSNILNFASIGAIKRVSELLPDVALDAVYTQARKDKYTQMITNYLNQM